MELRQGMRRGEILWVNFDPSQGTKIQKCSPAVIITVNALNRARGTVVVPLYTSAHPRPPIVIELPSAGEKSLAVCDQLCVADKGRFGHKICDLSSNDMNALNEELKVILGLI